MKEVLKFSASWCGPCKMLAMTVKELDDNTVPIKDIDIDENLELATKYGIRGVPTLVLLENGNEVKRVSGALTLPKLKEFING
jgi:thioredoxin 1